MNLKQRLSQAWAKSDGTTIREHTDRLLENLKLLREMYRERIENACPEEFRQYLWSALELACEYHDYGKLHCKFQREVVGNRNYTDRKVERIRHNLLSPAFIEEGEHDFVRDISVLAIVHHHEAETGNNVVKKVEKVLQQEFDIPMPGWHKSLLLKTEYEAVKSLSRVYGFPEDRLRLFYILVKGLLLRIDHASSNKGLVSIELEPACNVAKTITEKKGFELNDLQRYVLENREKCMLVSAPTGYGKTEAGFIYLESKGFFTIPIRTSANAIYMRAKELFEDKAGLMHSTALNFLVESERDRNRLEGLLSDFEYARNFAKYLVVCTPDQVFPFAFAYRGFEKSLAILSYSAVVIDEMQLFEPHTLGFIVEGIKIAKQLGSRVMVMTATLPEFVKRDLMGEGFEERVFDSKNIRHNLRFIGYSLLSEEAIGHIRAKAAEGKVLVITNTVRKAVELYNRLRAEGLEVELLHSRYILKHRKEKEGRIKDFFDKAERGVWITTQLAEVSLDLDADFLFTEYSTPDSLFQRLGRVNRKGTKPIDRANAYIFTQNCSGIGPVYRKSIHEGTKPELRDGFWSEEEKRRLVEEVYSEENLSRIDRNYLEEYRRARHYIKDVWKVLGYMPQEKKAVAQKLFRDIHSITVIPEKYKEELKDYLMTLQESRESLDRIDALNRILDYTFSIPAYERKVTVFEKISELKGFDIYWLKAPYDEEKGLFELPKDPEQDNIL